MNLDNTGTPELEMDALQREYQDEHISEMDREHSYGAYWRLRLAKQRSLNREELTELLEHPEWPGAINDTIKRLCIRRVLAPEEKEWLLEVLSKDDFAWQQVQALVLLEKQNIPWQEKLMTCFELHANWAAQEIVQTLSPEDWKEAKRIVAFHKKPKWILEK